MPPKKSKKQAAAKEPQEGEEGWVPPLPAERAPPLPTETAPPLPAEQPPLPAAEPVTELGGDDEDEEDGDKEGDDEEADNDDDEPSTSAAKGKGKADSTNAWQAVWSPERNAYYFWNTETDEVTWVNPLAPAGSDAPPLPNEPAPSAPASSSAPRAAPTTAPEMDPALAFLLPPEARTADGSSAMFNARTGRFTPVDYTYSVAHLDEWNRAKRMSERFFDVDGWEKQKAAENAKRKADEAAGVVRETKITKKDMDRFRRKKAEHKAKRQAWLYD
ncbi:uncharacterized protein LOC62_01G000849 [Vanrija pseudolonga]|uniref:WW domain-containing protein n=1 Tax=Vanrija pseudolonga TaxID=143232 RepID=A0AAF0Y037_9TREE|nr:hypothetical protein LOC62_01G000849 [Vanrija pseudolonga]